VARAGRLELQAAWRANRQEDLTDHGFMDNNEEVWLYEWAGIDRSK